MRCGRARILVCEMKGDIAYVWTNRVYICLSMKLGARSENKGSNTLKSELTLRQNQAV